jgi:hypothetical protein
MRKPSLLITANIALWSIVCCIAYPHVSYAQFNSTAVSTYCVNGPGDRQAYLFWNGITAYSQAACGTPAAYVCNSTGGTDVACEDMSTSSVTGKLVAKTIGGILCGPGGSTNCTAKIIYNQAPLNSTCTVRGSNGTPGTCDAVQNNVADRYNIDVACNNLAPCFFAHGSGSGYTLNSSISLTQPFVLTAVAYTINSSATETFLAVGNANIGFSTSNPGDILSTCDSTNSTIANVYQTGFAPSYLSDIILQCQGSLYPTYQNMFPGANFQSGGATSVSGTPVIMASGGSPVNFWSFGITTSNLSLFYTTGFWTLDAIHTNSCLTYGYTCGFSGFGDVVPFNAFWGLVPYNAAQSVFQSQKIVNVCNAGDQACEDFVNQANSGTLLFASPGFVPHSGADQFCSVPITSGTYNNSTGAVSLILANVVPGSPGPQVTNLVSGNPFALNLLTGTGSYASLNGGWIAGAGTTAGSGIGTVNFTATAGLAPVTPITITGGTVSTCTIKTFYDTSGANYCTGGVPCDLTQATITKRAILVNICFPNQSPFFYSNSCAVFANSSLQTYTGPGTSTTPTPWSVAWIGQRTGNTSAYNTVFAAGSSSVGYTNSPATSYVIDGTSGITSATSDNAWHVIVGISNGTNIKNYVDGALATSSASVGAALAQPYYLGSNVGSSDYLQGMFYAGGITNTDISSVIPQLTAQQQLYGPF